MTRKKKRNRGHFRKGKDPRRSGYKLTKADCQKGYQAALQTMLERGWDASAFFFRKIRGWYAKRRDHGQESDRPAGDGEIPF